MNNLLSQSIQGAVRHIIGGAFVYLAAKGFITNDQATQLIAATGAVVVMIIWSAANKYGLLLRVQTALGLPANSTVATLEQTIADQK